MKAIPSFQNYVKSEDKKVKSEYKKVDWAKETIDLTKPHGLRRVERKEFSRKNARGTDEVFFVDLPGTYDYDAYFASCLDPKLSLMIKGPFANLHWTFHALDEKKEKEWTGRRVVTYSRPFQSAPGRFVPQFLPNYKSEWYKQFKKIDDNLSDNMASFIDDIDTIISKSEAFKSRKSESQTEESEWEILGLRAYKVPNESSITFNILSSTPAPDQTIQAAEFDSSGATMLQLYGYASSIKKSKSRSAAEKLEIKEWKKTIPKKPIELKQGWPSGTAANWFKTYYGDDHKPVLTRVLMKSKDPTLQRLDPCEYNDTSRSLKTDMDILNSLPTEEFFSTMVNSKNAGQALINKLANIAFGHQSEVDAKELLRLLLADELKEEKRRQALEASMTPEARAAKEAKAKATNEKRKATIARNKAIKEAAALAQAAAAAAATAATTTAATITTTTAVEVAPVTTARVSSSTPTPAAPTPAAPIPAAVVVSAVTATLHHQEVVRKATVLKQKNQAATVAATRNGTSTSGAEGSKDENGGAENAAGADSGADSDDDLQDVFFSQNNTGTSKSSRSKTIGTKLYQMQREKAMKTFQKEQRNDNTTGKSTDVAAINPALARLLEADAKMLEGKFQKFNVNFENPVALDSFVIVKNGADDIVTRDSVAIVVSQDSKNKRQLSYQLLLLDNSKRSLHQLTIKANDLYRVEERV